MKPALFVLLACATLQGTAAAADEPFLAKKVFGAYMHPNWMPVLSTETNELRASDKFGFRMQLTLPNPDPERQKTVSSITTIETANEVACAVTTTNGLPFSYMTKGLWIGFFDRTKPGTLAYVTDGNLGWRFSGGTNKSEIVFKFGLVHEGIEKPTVSIDLRRVLNPLFWDNEPSFDVSTRELILTSDGGKRVYLRLNDDKKDQFGLREIRIVKGETVLRIYDIKPALETNSLPKLSEPDFDRLGLSIEHFDREGTISPTPPPDFPKNPAEREASQRLKKLLNVR